MLKKYRTIIPFIVLAIALIVIFIPSVPRSAGIIIMGIAAILIVLSNQGTFHFARANKILSQQKPGYLEKALALYERADKFGVPAQYGLIIGTMFIQHGDIEKGRNALEEVLKSKDKKLIFQAKEALSMYYWIKRDVDKAIKLCEEAKEMGLKDRNLYINLGTYYLSKGKTKDFKQLLRDAYTARMESIILIDLQAQYLIQTNDFERAGNFLKTLFDQAKPTFEDPYLHFAIIYMHYGEISLAINYLRDCLEMVTFSNVALYKSYDIEEMISALQNETTRWAFAVGVLRNPLLFLNGKMPDYDKEINKPNDLPVLPIFQTEGIKKDDINEKSEEEPDTSLTEADEEWLRRHQD